MKCFLFGTVLAQVAIINACLDAAASTVHIQNYDGPIYVHGDCRSPTINNLASTCDTYYPTIASSVPTCDNRYPTIATSVPTCDNRYPTIATSVSKCDNRYPTLTTLGSTYDNRLPTLTSLPTCDNQSPILHSSTVTVPYHQTVCETDCKCVTKHQTACVPVNTVQQNTYNPGYYSCQYPEDYYGYGYPDGQSRGYEDSCPKISETLIPLLKTYLTQSNGSPKHSCKCGRHS